LPALKSESISLQYIGFNIVHLYAMKSVAMGGKICGSKIVVYIITARGTAAIIFSIQVE
jgi:hypothetical protein